MLRSDSEILGTALFNATKELNFSRKDEANLLNVSLESICRMEKPRSIDIDSKAGDASLLFLRLYGSLFALTGGKSSQMLIFLESENLHLQGIPKQLVTHSRANLAEVVSYLEAMKAKI